MAGLPPRYRIEHYEDQNGDAPVHRWLLEELTPPEATILGIAMRHHLQERGPEVVETRYGRALGGGLYEFRLDDTVDDVLGRLGLKRKHKLHGAPTRALLFRVFFAVDGARVILLLAGYDKGQRPSKRYQQQQIKLARHRLADWKRRHEGGVES